MRFRTITVISVALLLFGWSATAAIPPTKAQQTVEEVCSRPPLATSVVGVFAVRMDGDTLANYNSRVRLVPASNMKLITTGLALNNLGADFRFETKLGYSGEIRDGVLRGDLYIVGGGDPTTGSKSDCAEPVAATFASWQKLLAQAGISSIDGRIIADPRYFDTVTPEGMGWTYDDLGTNYGAGPVGLNFFENAQNFLITPGTEGSAPNISPRYPDTPWMSWSNHALTGKARTRNTVYYINSHLAPIGEFAGSFPSDRKGYTLECSNRFAPYTCAYYFYNFLKDRGIEAKGGYADISPSGYVRTAPGVLDEGEKARKTDELTVIGSTFSPRLALIARDTNCESDNFFAETLLKTLAVSKGRSSQYDSCVAAAEDALSALGLNPASGCRIFDGSGLSRKNFVSASFFVNFLKKMLSSPASEAYIASLPHPGGKGTLEFKFPAADEGMRSRIRMKSGSMNGILCYSGYILSADGDPAHTVVFSVLTNNSVGSSWVITPPIDRIIEALAAEN